MRHSYIHSIRKSCYQNTGGSEPKPKEQQKGLDPQKQGCDTLGIHGFTLTLSPETPRKLLAPPLPFALTCARAPETAASTLLHHLRATRMTVVRQRDGSPVGARHFPLSLSSHARCLYRMDDLLETGSRRYSEDSRGILHLHGALHGLLESALPRVAWFEELAESGERLLVRFRQELG